MAQSPLTISRTIPFPIAAPERDSVVSKGREAFYALRREAEQAGTQGMSLEEINEEIRLSREAK